MSVGSAPHQHIGKNVPPLTDRNPHRHGRARQSVDWGYLPNMQDESYISVADFQLVYSAVMASLTEHKQRGTEHFCPHDGSVSILGLHQLMVDMGNRLGFLDAVVDASGAKDVAHRLDGLVVDGGVHG